MPSPKPPTILLFLKVPEPGFVKTRLAKTLGKTEACAVYRQLVAHTLSQIPADWPLRIHFAPSESNKKWPLGSELNTISSPNPMATLGTDLQVACEQAFAEKEGNTGVILLGGDCPGLTTAHLNECAQHLDSQKPVIGPSEDGGYWLLGLPAPFPELFQDIAWSTPQVLPATLALLEKKTPLPSTSKPSSMLMIKTATKKPWNKSCCFLLKTPLPKLQQTSSLQKLSFRKNFLASAPNQRQITNSSFSGTILRLNSLTSIYQRMKTENAVKERYAAASHAVEANLCCPVDYDPQFSRPSPLKSSKKITAAETPPSGSIPAKPCSTSALAPEKSASSPLKWSALKAKSSALI